MVDDIWRAADVKPFLADSPRSRVLFTTRNARIAADLGAEEQAVELLTEEQSRAISRQPVGRKDWAAACDGRRRDPEMRPAAAGAGDDRRNGAREAGGVLEGGAR